jgi:hypothetical protein
VAASRKSGRAVGADLVAAFRAEQRPLGGVPGSRRSGKSVTPRPEPILPLLVNGHDWRSRSPASCSRHPASRAVSRPGRPSACRVSFGHGATGRAGRGVGLARGVHGWLRFRAWSYSGASPIVWVSS